MSFNSKGTDDALRRVGRNLVNFQKLEQALKALVRLSNSSSSHSHPQPTFARDTKRLKRAGLAEVASLFNRALYEEAPPAETPASATEVRISNTFRLEFTSDEEARRKELVALARERNRLVHTDLFAIDFSSDSACRELSYRLDAQNQRIVGYLEFLQSVRDTHTKALEALVAFVGSEEFLEMLASNERDA